MSLANGYCFPPRRQALLILVFLFMEVLFNYKFDFSIFAVKCYLNIINRISRMI